MNFQPNSPAAFAINADKARACIALIDAEPHQVAALVAAINRPHGIVRERPEQGRLPV